jgi:hypothetical protein
VLEKRRDVGPLRVVNCEQHRTAIGEVHRQPVEAVQRAERGVPALRHELRPRLAEQALRKPGRPAEQPPTL